MFGLPIDKDELRKLQVNFEESRKDYLKDYIELDKQRKKFVKKFPKEKIKDMTLKEYVSGHGDSYSFCNWIERGLPHIGSIRGGYANKFGIYYDSEEEKYEKVEVKFGKSLEEAFINIKHEIYDLLEAGEKLDFGEIKKNKISPMFKGKILAVYFPDKFLSIYAERHVEYFLDNLKIYYGKNNHLIDKRRMLMDFKNNDEIMKKWNSYIFMKFLYDNFKSPERNIDNLPEELANYSDLSINFPDLNKTNPSIIDLQIQPDKKQNHYQSKKSSWKVDFERENVINHKRGKRGEEIVLKHERDFLKEHGRKDLASKIRWVSQEDDTLGYDILSFDKNGNKKYIEVKTTSSHTSNNIEFYLSANQYNIAKQQSNYFIYLVFNITSEEPKIWKRKNPIELEGKGMTFLPIKYKVVINAEKVKGD